MGFAHGAIDICFFPGNREIFKKKQGGD